MSERDPRVDPRPGDVVRKGSKTRRVIRALRRDAMYDDERKVYEVHFIRTGNRGEANGRAWIFQWVDWCRGAEVVATAGEG